MRNLAAAEANADLVVTSRLCMRECSCCRRSLALPTTETLRVPTPSSREVDLVCLARLTLDTHSHNKLANSYIYEVSTRRHLRSAGQGDLVVPRTRTVSFGPRSFSAADL